MASLATVSDYESLFGVTLDAGQTIQVTDELAISSGAVRTIAKQTISQVVNDAVTLRGTWGRMLTLPEQPVASVASVTIDTPGTATDVTVDVNLRAGGRLWRSAGWRGPDVDVNVTYTHGWATVPEDLVGIVCKSAARAVSNPAGQFQSVSVGESYRVTFAGTSNEQVGLLTKWEIQYIRDHYRLRW